MNNIKICCQTFWISCQDTGLNIYPLVLHSLQGIFQQGTQCFHSDHGHGFWPRVYTFSSHYFLQQLIKDECTLVYRENMELRTICQLLVRFFNVSGTMFLDKSNEFFKSKTHYTSIHWRNQHFYWLCVGFTKISSHILVKPLKTLTNGIHWGLYILMIKRGLSQQLVYIYEVPNDTFTEDIHIHCTWET